MVALEDFKSTRLLVTLAPEDRLCGGGGDFDVGPADAFEVQGAWGFLCFLTHRGCCSSSEDSLKGYQLKNISNTL